MTYTPKVLCFAGSLRRESFNKRLVKIGMAGAKDAGAQATYVDLADLPMPIYDGDYETEHGLPENAKKLKALMKEHQAFLISSPEYNSSISAALKNAIDWASRPEEGEAPLVCFKGKVAGLLAASPGALGGLRGLVTVRSILGNIGMIVIPDQVAVAKADTAFEPDGSLKDKKEEDRVKKVGATLASVTRRLFQPE